MLIHWVWLSERSGVNGLEKLALLEHFRDPEGIYCADSAALEQAGIVSQKGISALEDKSLTDAERILEVCAKKQIRLLTLHDERYPNRLKNIPDPPVLLYYTRELPEFDDNPVIGVVGTRKASIYGMNTAREIGHRIGRCGGIVVSGMAAGIDSMATAGALASGSSVVGVLGCGVDVVYPASSHALYRDMYQHGCLIAEYPPGTPPAKWNFPRRNRIISGLSCGVLVVEAPQKSGALITARQAADQGRDVFVVPGNINVASCAGSNALLRDGALMVTSGWDVLCEYTHLFPDKIRKDDTPLGTKHSVGKVSQNAVIPVINPGLGQNNDKKSIDNGAITPYSGLNKPKAELSANEQLLVELLVQGEWLIDDLIAASCLPAGAALAALTMLEVKGITRSLSGRRVVLKEQNLL